jgi:uncharacterized protein YbaR (Trm112 family)
MPVAACPQCRNELDVPDHLFGGPVRCASCMTVFTPGDEIPVVVPRQATPRRDEPVYDDEPTPRRSRTWLWVLLAGSLLISCTCIASCAGLFGVLTNPKMKPYTSDDGRFMASFPGDPKPIIKTADEGRDVGGVECLREMPSDERYFVEFVVLTPEELKQDPQTLAESSLKKWVQNLEGTILETNKVDHKGLPASQILGQLTIFKGNLVARAVRDGDRMYIVGVSGGIMPWDRRVATFLEDFTPIGAPAKDTPVAAPEKGRKKNPFKDE